MAKSNFKRKYFCTKRLLSLLFCFFVFSHVLFASKYTQLRVVPKTSFAFTNEDCIFELVIPGVSPSIVKTTIQSLPEDVRFVSSKKEQFFQGEEKATLVQFVFNFAKPGIYKLPRLAARISYGGYSLPFEPIEIIENPMTLLPQVFFQLPLDKTYYAGEKFFITLFAKYFKNINFISLSLSEDFILVEKQRYVKLPYIVNEFSTEETSLILFECIPLKSGELILPEIEIGFESWNGSHPVLKNPVKKINVYSKDNKKEISNIGALDYFIDSTKEISTVDVMQSNINKTKINLSKFFFIRKILKIFKIFLLCVLFVLFVLSILFFIFKKKKFASVLFFFLIFFSFVEIFITVALTKKYVVAQTNAHFYKIPEETSEVIQLFQSEILLELHFEKNDWMQVSFFNFGNEIEHLYWIKKEDVIFY
ncbi:MAG: hypothetical protein GX220_05785 [Treponema sp.]|nr:hypothetical protein [Treponema sp.]